MDRLVSTRTTAYRIFAQRSLLNCLIFSSSNFYSQYNSRLACRL